MSTYIVDENWAKKIAVSFLQEHHSVSNIEKAVFENGVWLIDVLVSSPKRRKIQVKINAKTGYILGWY